jgi:hypothetical protein
MSDAHNGFRVLNQKAIQHIRLSTCGREHASEIVWRARQAKLSCVECPVHIQYKTEKDIAIISVLELVRLGLSLIRYRWNGYTSTVPGASEEREHALQHIE